MFAELKARINTLSSKKCAIRTDLSSKKCDKLQILSSEKCNFVLKTIIGQVDMRRKITTELKKWKDDPDRKPLIMLGARQVGKTWIMKHFGEEEFENVAYVNCDEEPLAKALFEADYSIPRILLTLQAITGTKIEAGKTLIILDELQEAKRGLHSLKYFQENAPQYHVIAAGSLLGITIGKGESFPVGKVNILHMYPLDFEEFLMAMGKDSLCDVLHQSEWDVVNTLETKYTDMLRQYYYVGGMPEVVADFAKNFDLQKVRSKQETILDSYRRDISKHTTATESIRIGQVLHSLPSQLAKENKKFIYNVLKKGARANEYELAIQWLIDAGIIHKVCRVRDLQMPIKFYEDFSAFKLFLLDCGLFACMTGAPASQMLIGDNVFKEFKGAFTEQYVLQQLVSMNLPTYYWNNNNSSAEIDFVVQTDHVIPIEVKAEENVRSRSMSTYIHQHPQYNLKGLRCSMLGYKDQKWMVNIPLYGISKFFK